MSSLAFHNVTMKMAMKRTYSTAEICEMLDISKSTLFRWERGGLIPSVPRDAKGRRRYTDEHIRAISQRQLGEQFQRTAKNKAGQRQVLEAQSLAKLLAGDIKGLIELEEHSRLSLRTIRELMRMALDEYEPGDPTFCDIIRVVYKQSCPDASQE